MESFPRCSLEEMLAARDNRQRRQYLHFQTTPEATLMVATVVAPGAYKLTPATEIVATAMEHALKTEFLREISSMEHLTLVSGHEIWLTLSCAAEEAKRRAVGIEETHMLGRLFDIDVILPDVRPLGRHDIGMSPRKCILCDNEARLCMRLRRHAPSDVGQFIKNLIHEYIIGKQHDGYPAT